MILSLFIALITDTYETIKVGSSVAVTEFSRTCRVTIRYNTTGGGELVEC